MKKKKGKFSGIFGCLLTQNPIINELIKILNSLDSSRPYTSLLENAETGLVNNSCWKMVL